MQLDSETMERLNALAGVKSMTPAEVVSELVNSEFGKGDPFMGPLEILAIQGVYGFTPSRTVEGNLEYNRDGEILSVNMWGRPRKFVYWSLDRGSLTWDFIEPFPEEIVREPAINVRPDFGDTLKLIARNPGPVTESSVNEFTSADFRTAAINNGWAYRISGLWRVTPWGRKVCQTLS